MNNLVGCSTSYGDIGLLDNTVVIITSDHGEAFGDHGHFGHGPGVYLDEIGVPLVILSPGAPAGRVVESPVSLRDLPATVVDLLGLPAGSPFPGRSLAAYWHRARRQMCRRRSPPQPFQRRSTRPSSNSCLGAAAGTSGSGCPWWPQGHHYLRDSIGTEALYDLRKRSVRTGQSWWALHTTTKPWSLFRKMLLEVLTDNPGSIEVDKAYLEAYKQGLQALIPESSPGRVAAGH